MIDNYSTLSPLICNAKKSSFVSSRTMLFTEEDKIIIKHYRQNYGWGGRKIFSRIGNGKPWTRIGTQHLIEKIDKAKIFQVKICSVEHLCERLGEAWEQISWDEVDRVIHSFRRRLKACIKNEGKRFKYKLGMKS